jgi:hypothetical protein
MEGRKRERQRIREKLGDLEHRHTLASAQAHDKVPPDSDPVDRARAEGYAKGYQDALEDFSDELEGESKQGDTTQGLRDGLSSSEQDSQQQGGGAE